MLHRRALILEDSPKDQKRIQDLLDARSIEYDTVDSALAARIKLKEKPYLFIILDLDLGTGIDEGKFFLDTIYREGIQKPTIIVSYAGLQAETVALRSRYKFIKTFIDKNHLYTLLNIFDDAIDEVLEENGLAPLRTSRVPGSGGIESNRSTDNQYELDAGLTLAEAEMHSDSFKQWAGASSTTIAITFTDIVDSTKLATQLGNESMNAVRRAHFNRGQHLIEKYGGYQIKTIGDSLMVAFRTAISALDFVLDFSLDTGDRRLNIRSGIHVGPIYIEENDAFGAMVNYTARVVGFAKGPEIWLSSLAKDHIDQDKAERHKNLEWYKYPDCILKGFVGPHTLWANKEPTPHQDST